MKRSILIAVALIAYTGDTYCTVSVVSQPESEARYFASQHAEDARAEYKASVKQAASEFANKLLEARKLYLSRLARAQQEIANAESPNPTELLRITSEQSRVAGLIAEDILNSNEPDIVPAASIKITGRNYQLGLFREGELTYIDHNDKVRWKQIPVELDGWEITRFPAGHPPKIYVTAATSGRVFVIANADVANHPEHPLMKSGWQPVNYANLLSGSTSNSQVVFDDTAKHPAKWMLFARYLRAGEEVEVPQDGYAGAPIVVPAWSVIRD